MNPVDIVSPHDLADGAAQLVLDEQGRVTRAAVAIDLDEVEHLTHREVLRAIAGSASPRQVLLGLRTRPLPTESMGPWRELLEHVTTTLVPRSHDGQAGLVACVPVDDPARGVVTMLRAAEAHPAAALVLDALLGINASSSVDDGLVAEAQAYSLLMAGTDFQGWRATHPEAYPALEEPTVLAAVQRQELTVTLDWLAGEGGMDTVIRHRIAEALNQVDSSVTLVEIHATGADFCGSCRPHDVMNAVDVPAAHLMRMGNSLGRAAYRVHDRLVAHVQGRCVGAGLELVAFARRAQATDDARFALPQMAMGLIPGAGGTVSVTKRIGRWRTAYLVLMGESVDAETARRWGLVDAVAPMRRVGYSAA